MHTFMTGLTLGLSLILAIGAQNAFVLKQGLKQEHVFWVCLVCALSDALLMGVGVSGFHHIIQRLPWIDPVARYGGALFLACYGFLRFKAAWLNRYSVEHSTYRQHSLSKTLLTTLAFTWLNPHVYLDTVVLIGSISTQYQPHVMLFWLGTVSASFMFFFSLGFGARLVKPYFETPFTWKILDILIGCVMWGLAIGLLTHR